MIAMLYDILIYWVTVMALLLLWGLAAVIIARIKEPGLFKDDLDIDRNNRERWENRYGVKR